MCVKFCGAEEVSGSWRRQLWGEVRGTKIAHIEFLSIAIGELLLISYIT